MRWLFVFREGNLQNLLKLNRKINLTHDIMTTWSIEGSLIWKCQERRNGLADCLGKDIIFNKDLELLETLQLLWNFYMPCFGGFKPPIWNIWMPIGKSFPQSIPRRIEPFELSRCYPKLGRSKSSCGWFIFLDRSRPKNLGTSTTGLQRLYIFWNWIIVSKKAESQHDALHFDARGKIQRHIIV